MTEENFPPTDVETGVAVCKCCNVPYHFSTRTISVSETTQEAFMDPVVVRYVWYPMSGICGMCWSKDPKRHEFFESKNRFSK